MVRGNAKDLVLPPPDSEEFVFLARRVCYTTDDWQAGARHLQSDIQQHMGKTREFSEKTSGRLYAHKRNTPALAMSYRKSFYNSPDSAIMSHTRGRYRA